MEVQTQVNEKDLKDIFPIFDEDVTFIPVEIRLPQSEFPSVKHFTNLAALVNPNLRESMPGSMKVGDAQKKVNLICLEVGTKFEFISDPNGDVYEITIDGLVKIETISENDDLTRLAGITLGDNPILDLTTLASISLGQGNGDHKIGFPRIGDSAEQ